MSKDKNKNNEELNQKKEELKQKKTNNKDKAEKAKLKDQLKFSELTLDEIDEQDIEDMKLDQEEIDFEKALDELERIVEDLEKGGLSLDKTVEEFSQGMKLLKFCHQKLDKAENKIELMLKEDEEFKEAVPFDSEDEENH